MQIPETSKFHPGLYNLPFVPAYGNMPMPVNMQIPMNYINMNAQMQMHPSVHPQGGNFDPNVYNMLLMRKLQNDLQSQMIKSHISRLITAKAGPGEPSLKASLYNNDEENYTDITKNEVLSPVKYLPELCDANKSLKAHIKDMMYFVLNNFGSLNDEEIRIEKLKYRNNKDLLNVFEALLSKYICAVKTKEEMVKHAFRKALKYMKQKLKRELKKDTVPTPENESKRQFRHFLEEMSNKVEDDIEDCESTGKTNSSNKKSSNGFEVIREAFLSEEFCQGFGEYLQTLDASLELDNNKKIDKFVKFIEGSMKKNTIKEIKKYKRIPWLKVWIENTKKVAYELMFNHQNNVGYETKKILKKEENVSSFGGSSDDSYSSLKLEALSE